MKANGGVHRLTRARSKIQYGCNLEQVADGTLRSLTIPVSRLTVQSMLCFISLILGFQFTREATIFAGNLQHGTVSNTLSSFNLSANIRSGIRSNFAMQISQTLGNGSDVFGTLVRSILPPDPVVSELSESKKPVVWQHEILVRPWPHPDPLEVMQAYGLISRIQLEQRQIHGIKDWKPIIAITPTFVRAFQALHLTALMHTLSLVPGPVTWIVIEAGGVTNETASLLTQAHVHRLLHLGFGDSMTPGLEEQPLLETRLRIEGLRCVQEHKLEGIIVFADESNVHSLEFFNMVQEVNWFGVVSVGMLGHASFGEPMEYDIGALHEGKNEEQGSHQLSGTILRFEPQVQGPVCDSMGKLVGWHTFDGFHLEDRVFKVPDKSHEGRLEWAGFVLNARAVWEAGSDEPVWLDSWLNWTRSSGDKNLPDIRSILRDEKRVKLLGGCGHQVLLWWARMEAHANISYPSNWALDSPLEIVIPARSTPWTDMPKGRPSLPHLPTPSLLEAVTPAPTPSRHKGGNRVKGRDSKLKHSRHRQDPLKGKVTDDRRNPGSSRRS